MAASAPAPEDDPLAIALADAPDPNAPAAPPPPGDASPGGVAPRGGPLRGQRLTPPPPPPGTPPLSLSDALQQAKQNLLPSAASNISDTLHALAPWNYGEDIRGLNQLGVGVESKLGLIDQGNPAEQAKDEAALNAVGKMYTDRYGSWEGFKRTLANNPFAIGSDIASVATLPLGGEGLISKVPDAAEAALAGAGAAKQGAAVSNAMRAAGAVAKPVLQRARWLDPAYGASQIGGGAVNAARALGNVPVLGRAVKGAIGAGIGNVAGGFVPFIGHTGGTIIGEHIAEGIMGPGGPGWLSKGVNAGAKTLPLWSTVGGTEPMSPAEQGQGGGPPAPGHPGAATRAAPGASPPASGQGGSGDPFADAMADSGLEGPVAPAAAPPAPSSGLQGGPPTAGDPRNAKDVVRQAEGGYNQPVGFMPKGGGSARGAYQMIDSTYAMNLRKYYPEIAAQFGNSLGAIKAFRNTSQGWALNDILGSRMVDDEIAQLQHEGIAPTPDNVATRHMLGNTRLLHADPNTPIEQVTGADQRAANASAFRNVRTAGDFLNWMHGRNARAIRQLGQQDEVPFADGGRVGFADGGNVVDMTEALMRRAEAHHKASQQDTKPLLGVPDETIAKALRVAQAGI